MSNLEIFIGTVIILVLFGLYAWNEVRHNRVVRAEFSSNW